MSTVVIAEPYNSSKEKFRLVKEFKNEMKKKQVRHIIEVDENRNIIVCCYYNKKNTYN
jgi:hypothetical protein